MCDWWRGWSAEKPHRVHGPKPGPSPCEAWIRAHKPARPAGPTLPRPGGKKTDNGWRRIPSRSALQGASATPFLPPLCSHAHFPASPHLSPPVVLRVSQTKMGSPVGLRKLRQAWDPQEAVVQAGVPWFSSIPCPPSGLLCFQDALLALMRNREAGRRDCQAHTRAARSVRYLVTGRLQCPWNRWAQPDVKTQWQTSPGSCLLEPEEPKQRWAARCQARRTDILAALCGLPPSPASKGSRTTVTLVPGAGRELAKLQVPFKMLPLLKQGAFICGLGRSFPGRRTRICKCAELLKCLKCLWDCKWRPLILI